MNIQESDNIIPLTPQVATTLAVLAAGPQHAYLIAKRCASESAGAVAVRPGAMYAILDRLVAQGYVKKAGKAQSTSSPFKRQLYELTKFGWMLLDTETQRQADFVGLARMRLAKHRQRNSKTAP